MKNVRWGYVVLALACLTIAAAPTYTSLFLSGSSTGTLQLKAPAAAGTGSVLTFPGHTTDFSATGGTSQVVKQTSSGGALTVARLACADLSDSSTGCTGTTSSGGDVVGPGSSTAGHFAIFDGATGKLLKDTLAAPGTAAVANTGTSGATVPLLNGTNVWSGQQTNSITTLAISTATFTPDGTNNDFAIILVHASCPCTLANPSVTPVAGTKGVIYVTQSATGSDTITTWGSDYVTTGGTAAITLSTAASVTDVFSYTVKDSTHIVLSAPYLNPTH